MMLLVVSMNIESHKRYERGWYVLCVPFKKDVLLGICHSGFILARMEVGERQYGVSILRGGTNLNSPWALPLTSGV